MDLEKKYEEFSVVIKQIELEYEDELENLFQDSYYRKIEHHIKLIPFGDKLSIDFGDKLPQHIQDKIMSSARVIFSAPK